MFKKLGLIILFLSLNVNAHALNLSRVKTWSAEVLTHTDLNAEFDNILNHTISNADIASDAAIPGSKLNLAVPGAIGGTTPSTGAFTTLSSTGDTTIGNAAADSVLFNANVIEFEGATANGYENVFSMPDPTAADNTFTFPQLSGTIVLSTGAGTNIDIGTYSLTANTLVSDVATGTAPLTVSSTTTVTNLSADTVDGINSTSTDLKPFGAWVDKSSSYGAQQAATDGFVVARAGGNPAASITGLTDANADPTTARFSATTVSAASAVAVNFTMPVKKGDYWKVVLSTGSIDSVFWIPLGN